MTSPELIFLRRRGDAVEFRAAALLFSALIGLAMAGAAAFASIMLGLSAGGATAVLIVTFALWVSVTCFRCSQEVRTAGTRPAAGSGGWMWLVAAILIVPAVAGMVLGEFAWHRIAMLSVGMFWILFWVVTHMRDSGSNQQ
jgi:hypothetical protein